MQKEPKEGAVLMARVARGEDGERSGSIGESDRVRVFVRDIARVGMGVKWSQVLKNKFPVESSLEEEVS